MLGKEVNRNLAGFIDKFGYFAASTLSIALNLRHSLKAHAEKVA